MKEIDPYLLSVLKKRRRIIKAPPTVVYQEFRSKKIS
jgi:hypothetical protein